MLAEIGQVDLLKKELVDAYIQFSNWEQFMVNRKLEAENAKLFLRLQALTAILRKATEDLNDAMP